MVKKIIMTCALALGVGTNIAAREPQEAFGSHTDGAKSVLFGIANRYQSWRNRPREASFEKVYDKLTLLIKEYTSLCPYLSAEEKTEQLNDITSKINTLCTQIANLSIQVIQGQVFSSDDIPTKEVRVGDSVSDYTALLRPLMLNCNVRVTWSNPTEGLALTDDQNAGNNNLIEAINIQITKTQDALARAKKNAKAKVIPLAVEAVDADAAAAVPVGDPLQQKSPWMRYCSQPLSVVGVLGALAVAGNALYRGHMSLTEGQKMSLYQLFLTGTSPLHKIGLYSFAGLYGIARMATLVIKYRN